MASSLIRCSVGDGVDDDVSMSTVLLAAVRVVDKDNVDASTFIMPPCDPCKSSVACRGILITVERLFGNDDGEAIS